MLLASEESLFLLEVLSLPLFQSSPGIVGHSEESSKVFVGKIVFFSSWVNTFWDACLQFVETEFVGGWVKEFIVMGSNILQLSNFQFSLSLHLLL